MNAKLEESELIESAKLGEEKAFERIFRLHKDRVFSVCMRMTGNYYEAEDLMQESFALAFRNLKGFRGESAFSTWLHRITVNTAIDALRKRHSRLDTATDELNEQELPVMTHAAGVGDLTLERLRIERAITALAPGYRVVLVLHDVEGHSHEEIAQWLATSVGTCKSQLHKARRKMRELLSRS